MVAGNLVVVSHMTRESEDQLFRFQEAVRRFFLRDWFSRLWVIQEFVLTREVNFHCGQRKLDWRHLFAACLDYGPDAPVPSKDTWAASFQA